MEAELAYTGPSLDKVQSGMKPPLTMAEKSAKYRRKLKGAPPGTPQHDKWQAQKEAHRMKMQKYNSSTS